MRSGSRNRIEKSLALRLTVWYAASFLVITVALSIISYVYLFSAVRDNRKIIQSRIKQFTAIAHDQGVDSIGRSGNIKYSKSVRKAVVIRVVDAHGDVRFQSNPEIWTEFQSAYRTGSTVGAWQYVPSSQDRDVLELMTVRLPGEYLLQVGKEIQDRKEILEHYRDTMIGVTSGMILIGLAGGAFLAFRAMQPVRHLSQVIQSIVLTGNINARVPESGRGDELDDLSRLFNQMLGRIEALICRFRAVPRSACKQHRRIRSSAVVAEFSYGYLGSRERHHASETGEAQLVQDARRGSRTLSICRRGKKRIHFGRRISGHGDHRGRKAHAPGVHESVGQRDQVQLERRSSSHQSAPRTDAHDRHVRRHRNVDCAGRSRQNLGPALPRR